MTLLELQRFLIANMANLRQRVDGQGEVIVNDTKIEPGVAIDKILKCLDAECPEVKNTLGFCHFSGREALVQARLDNYFFGIEREKLVKKYIAGLKHLPFIRGAALGGSQAMGLQKPGSDIDLLIITDEKFLWLARTLATIYFQMLGRRRHGKKIANRFCLNHYLAGPKVLDQIRNLYSAMEYGRLRPLVCGQTIAAFQQNNAAWIKQCFSNWQPVIADAQETSAVQKILESLFTNNFGQWLENKLKTWQMPRIKKQKFIIVEEDELSFHPDSKQQALLSDFFKFQEQKERVVV